MTDDEREDLVAQASAMINWPCTACGLVTSPYQLVEVRVLGQPTRYLCWDCLLRLFDGEEPELLA